MKTKVINLKIRAASFGILTLAALIAAGFPAYAEETTEQETQTTGEDQTRGEFRQEKIEAMLERINQNPELKKKVDQNGDGNIDKTELRQAHEKKRQMQSRDKDNNPPGMSGGPGTNWENRPGPQGGAGSSPNYQGNGNGYGPKKDFDNNPPGMRGGPGTNWENRPGPQGGAGTSPNKQGLGRKDFDNNPPGMAGGRGTNWENRPGPQGGAGASPNKRK